MHLHTTPQKKKKEKKEEKKRRRRKTLVSTIIKIKTGTISQRKIRASVLLCVLSDCHTRVKETNDNASKRSTERDMYTI